MEQHLHTDKNCTEINESVTIEATPQRIKKPVETTSLNSSPIHEKDKNADRSIGSGRCL